MNDLNLSQTAQDSILCIVSALLLIGNIEFTKSPGVYDGSLINEESGKALEKAAELLGLSAKDLFIVFSTTQFKDPETKQINRKLLNPDKALSKMNSFSKAIYGEPILLIVDHE